MTTLIASLTVLTVRIEAFLAGRCSVEHLRSGCQDASQWLEHGPVGSEVDRRCLKAALDRAEAILAKERRLP